MNRPDPARELASRTTPTAPPARARAAWAWQCVIFALLWLGQLHAALAAVPAGTAILAQASATYHMAGIVQPLTAWSPVVKAQIVAVESLTLAGPAGQRALPGADVSLNYLLTNTGNTASRYTFQLTATGCGVTDVTLGGLRLALDTNGNGLIDPGEQIAVGGVVASLPSGQSASLIVHGSVPTVAAGTACVTLSGTTADQGQSATVSTPIRVGPGAALSLNKTVASAGALVPGTSTVDFTLTANNIGTEDAGPTPSAGTGATPVTVNGVPRAYVLIRDTLPAGTRYVMGTLQSSQPGAVRLYRLPGDPPFSYRTIDDATAIEVAVGLPSIAARSAATLAFRALVTSDAPAGVVNVGDADYQSTPGQQAGARSNAVVLPVNNHRLGLALQTIAVAPQADAAGASDGTAVVTFRARLRNYGSGVLHSPQIHHLIAGGSPTGAFGALASTGVPGVGQYSPVAGSARIVSATPSGTVVVPNTAFNGSASADSLLAPGAMLPVGGDVTIEYSVRVNFAGRTGTVLTTASASAGSNPGQSADVGDDASANGTDPDPAGTGMPQTQASPTPVVAPPMLSLVHTTAEPRRVGIGQFEIDHTITVRNTSAVTANGVRIFNNLECALKPRAGGAVSQWQLLRPPVVTQGKLVVNSGYTGISPGTAPCGASFDTDTGAPLSDALSLTDGSAALAPGESETFTFTVSVSLGAANGGRATITHRVWSVAYDAPGALATRVVSATSGLLEFVLLIDPQGIVYDATTRAPIAGATVRLTRTACQSGTLGPITAAEIAGGGSPAFTYHADGSVSMVTGATGEYQFFWVSPPVNNLCTYTIAVTPPTTGTAYAASSSIPPQPGTYAGCAAVVPNASAPQGTEPTTWHSSFVSGYNSVTSTACEVLHNHVPLDQAAPATTTLLLEKSANKKELELGDFIDYKLTVANRGNAPASGISFADTLPPGFAYVAGTTFFNGVRVADPVGGAGPALAFAYPTHTLAAGDSVSLQYRVKVGVGAPTGAPAINRATARTIGATSNEAVWSVKVTGGVFSDDAFAVGKVFLDCNRNGEQDGDTEPGIPGVRLFLENGTTVITDGEGRWSLFGLKPITHAIKLDRRTLPEGAQPLAWDNRNAGSAESRFLDVKKGELAKANFPIAGCEAPGLLDAVKQRRGTAKAGTELDNAARQRLAPSTAPNAASGPGAATSFTANGAAPASAPLIALPAALGGAGPAAFGGSTARPPFSPAVPAVPAASGAPAPAAPVAELETLLPGLDPTPAFLGLKDGDTVPSRTLNVRVKGPLGTTLSLSVGGTEVGERRVGKKADLGSTGTTAWEYIGVNLQPGRNRLQLTVIDAMGNPRGEVALSVTAPADLARIHIDAGAARVNADPLTPVPLTVRLTDAAGVPVTARTVITLQADRGTFADTDLNPIEPGVQVNVEGGSASVRYLPPAEPGPARLRANADLVEGEHLLTVLPHLQPMSGIGIVEAIFSSRQSAGTPAGADSHASAFEAELGGIAREGRSGRAAARTAFYFKGTVKGEYLLTAAYDSDKTTKDRLFRDIRPDEYYPIYGDDSTRGYDAQSIGKLYVRVDKERSYLLYGDFVSSASPEVRRLSQVNRSLNGIKHHYETERVRVTSHAARTAARQQVEEVPANGLSFYFLAGVGDIVVNSEQVQVLVRSRAQPQLVLATRNLVRNTDYTFEPLTRRLTLAAPLPSVDADLNPQSVRVSYDVDQGGPEHLTAGVDAQFKLGERVQVGVAAAKDDNPENNRRGLQAVTAMARVGEATVVAAEAVRTESDLVGTGGAQRVEIRHAQGDFKASAEVNRTSATFENPGATTTAGRTEATARAEYPINDTTRLRAEATYSRNDNDPAATPTRNVAVAVHKKINETVAVEAGLRDGNTASAGNRAGSFDYGAVPGTTLAGGSATPLAGPTTASPDAIDTTTARARLTLRPSFMLGGEVFGEVEQDLHDSDRRLLAVGGSYAIGAKARVYARREFNSSLYENEGGNVNRVTSVIGIDGAYMEGGRAFNEYRMGTQGASTGTGLRHTFTLSETLHLTASAERSHQLSGTGDDATAATLGVEHSNGPWRGSAALEWREAGEASSWLVNLGAAWRLDEDWTLLARSVLTQTGDPRAGLRRLSRVQVGAAWRPAHTDAVNGLVRYENRQETIGAGTTGTSPYSLFGSPGAALPGEYGTHLVAGVLNVNPRRGDVITTRYAARLQRVTDDIADSQTFTQLLMARYTHDLTPDWDIGVQAGILRSRGGARQNLLGLEAGYQVANGLWVSAGYNWRGLRDAELAGANHTNRGWYLRLRYKFDETTLGLGGGVTASAPAAEGGSGSGSSPAAAGPVAAATAAVQAASQAPTPLDAADGLTQPLPERLLWSEGQLFAATAGSELSAAGRARIERLGALLKHNGTRAVDVSLGHGDTAARLDTVWLPRAKALRAQLRKACGCAVGMGMDTQPVPAAPAGTPASGAPAFTLFVQAVPGTTAAAATVAR